MKTLQLMGVVLLSAVMAFAESTTGVAVKAQTICPVMGGKVSTKVFADYQGERVFFCCKGCIATFNKEPEKYIKQLKEQGVSLAKTPEAPAKK